jgi:hypothetical protein
MLPTLPTYLRHLCCAYNYLTWLPTLPQYIEDIECQCNELIRLPSIPSIVLRINACHNQLMEYPMISNQAARIFVDNNPLKEHILDTDESIIIDSYTPIELTHIYSRHYRAMHKLDELEESQLRTHARCAVIKEEIMIKTWHPSRVLYLLEAGYDIEDM